MFSPLYITIAILILIVFILIIHTFVLEHRLRSLFRGQKGQSLEKVIQDMQNRLNSHNAQAVKNSNDINNLSNRLRSRIRNVSTLRFKPFEDAGSNQSFAIAMIDDDANGVVLSSLYTRDRMSVFAKPIKSGKSEYELTNEEKSVIEGAMQEII
jgi:hypothetical protein